MPPMISKASLQLRSTIGHNDDATPVMDQSSASAPLHEPTHTADPSGDLRATQASVTRSDATPNAGSEPPRDEAAMPPVTPPSMAASEAEPVEAELVRAKSSETAIAETETVETDASEEGAKKSDANDKTVADISPSAPDAKEDQARLPETEKPAITTTPKRTGQIAVFISRKDSASSMYGRISRRCSTCPCDRAERPAAGNARIHGARPTRTTQRPALVGGLACRCGRGTPSGATRMSALAPAQDRRSRRDEALPLPNSPAEALDRITIPRMRWRKLRSAFHRQLDHRFRSGHHRGRNRRRNRFHRFAALARSAAVAFCGGRVKKRA
jgi:hypothetical protein